MRYKYLLIILIGSGLIYSVQAQSIWDSIKEKGKQLIGTDSCLSYSDYTCKQLENSKYNVYVWLAPSKLGDDPFTVGVSNSLSSCASMARNYSYEKNRTMDDYICCLITKNSSCAEKHR